MYTRSKSAGTPASTSDVVLRDKPVAGIDDSWRANVIDLALGASPQCGAEALCA